ncbi:MAG TPA: LptF/LptG family permease [Gemmatimonadales bacterium]|nr:LptF/LptG family permease [Gemmatimonadales bacterium]
MRLLYRYLVRQFLPPLMFAFAAMTSIMLLNQIARRFGALVGKGLPWSVIGDVFLLCLPFIIAMTLPMAVLIAVLYTYSHLAADSEITAMRASGVSVYQLLRPMLYVGAVLTAVNFWFTDQILPDSNAKLRNLLINIQRKKPTLELREQVINEIPPSGLFLRASRIDPITGRLRSVTIYDMGSLDTRRIIYADSGQMGFTHDGTNLQMRLYHGAIHAFKQSDPSLMQVTDFLTDVLLVRDVSNRLDLDANDGVRGERELGTCEMMGIVRGAERDMALAEERRHQMLDRDLRALLGVTPTAPRSTIAVAPMPGYCRLFAALGRKLGTAKADSAAQTPSAPLVPAPAPPAPSPDLPRVVPLGGVTLPKVPQQAPAVAVRQPRAITTWSDISVARDEIQTSVLQADTYLVEVHKKWAISVACLVFAIVGIPMALRFPRGGMGLVIGGGLFVFSIYYVGLIAGESLGKKGLISPWISMWGPNLIFGGLGLIGLWRVNRESGSTRGGDLAELWESLTGRFRRLRAD